jgi:hypothetical protein
MTKYKFWQDSLAGLKPPIINEFPECGFWRMKKGGRWIPVAVWPLPGANQPLGFKFGSEVVGHHLGIEQWPWYAANPITEAEYRKVERGEDWSDADPVVAALLEKPRATRSPGIPNPKADAELEQAFIAEDNRRNAEATAEFAEQITAALGGVPTYAKIESDEADVRALSLRNMLNELGAAADKAREAEKAPHLKASRDIDAKWQPLVKSARDGAGKIKAARDDWSDSKRRAAVLAQVRAAEAAEKHRHEVAAAAAANKPAPPPPPPSQSNLPPPTAQVRPIYGKASGTGTKVVVTEVDFDKMFAALKLRPDWPQFAEIMRELAQKMASKGIILDGVTTEEKSNTR